MAFEDFARVEPSILECHIVSGEDTHLLKIRTDSPASLRDLLARLREFPGIARTVISLCTIKESGGPPLPHPETKHVFFGMCKPCRYEVNRSSHASSVANTLAKNWSSSLLIVAASRWSGTVIVYRVMSVPSTVAIN